MVSQTRYVGVDSQMRYVGVVSRMRYVGVVFRHQGLDMMKEVGKEELVQFGREGEREQYETVNVT